MLKNRSIPSCTVIPEIAYPDVEAAAAWLIAAFGFTLRVAIGNHRAQMNVEDGAMVVTEMPADGVWAPRVVMVRVEDVDVHCARAIAHWAKIVHEPQDYPYGERQYAAEDFAGNRWKFTQSIADVAPEEWGGVSGELG